MLNPNYIGDGTVTEQHLTALIDDVKLLAPFCEDLVPPKPGLWLRREQPLDGGRNIVVVSDTKLYDGNNTPRFIIHSVSLEEIRDDIDPNQPTKVQSSYQVGVDTVELGGEPILTPTFVVNHLQRDDSGSWRPIPRQASRFYADETLGLPVWQGEDLDPEELEARQAELAAAEEIDRLEEAWRLELTPPASDLARFNQYHGPLLAVQVELGVR